MKTKLDQAIEMIDTILSKMKLDRTEHEAVYTTFKIIVDAAKLSETKEEKQKAK